MTWLFKPVCNVASLCTSTLAGLKSSDRNEEKKSKKIKNMMKIGCLATFKYYQLVDILTF